jgi:4-hydroxybenzoate polyprenyltransferase
LNTPLLDNSIDTPHPNPLLDIAHAVRVRQWAKNVLLFGGFLFAGKLRAPAPEMWSSLGRVFLAFLCFCALSSVAYLINDWRDIERDRLHPRKKHRPLASGRMSKRAAAVTMLTSLVVAALCLYFLMQGEAEARDWAGRYFLATASAYLALTLAYSFVLKNEVIVDVLCLASGFVLRVVAGCVAIPVEISPWIVFCTFTLALFVALCKRRAELIDMGDAASSTRGVLQGYTAPLLDSFITVAAGLTIVSYSLYTFNASHSAALGALSNTPLLMTTIPFVVYGVFRYLLLAHSSTVGGAPEQMLRDRPLMINVALWITLVAFLTAAEKL